MRILQRFPVIMLLCVVLAACASPGDTNGSATPTATPTKLPAQTAAPSVTATSVAETCPLELAHLFTCFTPHALRVAYGVESLIERGFTGKGQTVVDIVSFGSPTLQQDMDIFDRQFGLPPITVTIIAPLGAVPYNPTNTEMNGWAYETELDVQIIHAVAPGANIVVLTSPVDETEGTIGMPEFLKLEQYAVAHKLGQVFSQSYVASETTLADSAGRKLVQTYADFYKQITTQQGWTIVSGSGDHGATDYEDIAATKLSPTPIVNFPADVPWVTAVGGTSLQHAGNGYQEIAWTGSGGGFSSFFSEPDFQQSLPQSVQALSKGRRGLPDITADADPNTGMAFYSGGQWQLTGGTSASTPFWGALIAIADQMAGHPLGFINPGIYKVATSANVQQDFRDITAGNNTNSSGSIQVNGYSAVAGWDAVTGWGSPIAEKLLPDLNDALQ